MLSLAEAVESAAVGAGLSILLTYLHSRRNGAEALDAELRRNIENKDEIIRQNQLVIDAQRVRAAEKKRTPAQQYHYDQAKASLARLGPKAALILRYLKLHGEILFAPHIPTQFPENMPAQEALTILENCKTENLVTSGIEVRRTGGVKSIQISTYRIAPGVVEALTELLYE